MQCMLDVVQAPECRASHKQARNRFEKRKQYIEVILWGYEVNNLWRIVLYKLPLSTDVSLMDVPDSG